PETHAVAVTKSWESKVLAVGTEPGAAARIGLRQFAWLAASSLLVSIGLALVYMAKTHSFPDLSSRIARGELLDLNAVSKPEQLLPFLQIFPNESERTAAATKIFDFLTTHRPIKNVGALARLRVNKSEIEEHPEWSVLARQQTKPRRTELQIPLLPLAKVKPALLVRTPREYQTQFLIWTGTYFAGFYIVFLIWRWSAFRGDFAILPAIQLLTGFGLILAVSLRDPLRDTLEFSKCAWGVALGCVMLLLPSLRIFNYQRFSKWCYTPLFAAFLLFLGLLRFGSGPGGNDAKVNLGPFQPVEAIKILLVFFLAGYFAQNWERLRDLREKRLVPRSLRFINLPRFSHVLPVMCAVVCALGLFFLLKDLGPALVTGFLFLAMFWAARGRAGLALLGIALLVGGVTIGYKLGKPTTVVERIEMWLSPWDNDIHGGNQLAHSLWAFATGGTFGSGPGWGDPAMIPAGNTDLVLPAIGEEWGFAGVAAVLLLLGFLVHRAFRIGLRAPNEYGLFLALGLGALIAFEMLLISGGVLGAIPLSGVVSPFLSEGNTAMLANFLIFGILLAISNHTRTAADHEPFRRPVRSLERALAVCTVALLCLAGYYQIAHDREFLARDTKVFEDDGVKRPQHNPRLNSLAHEIHRGDIFDRNGVLLATSDWSELEQRRAEYAKLGVNIDIACSRLDNRHYPFGPATAHVLGDWRTGENFHATNASLIEHDSNSKLQGFTDYSELVPLVRYRHHPGNPDIVRLMARDRTLKTSLDIRLQLQVDKLLRDRLAKAHKDHGAAVVMDPKTGDLLALVSEPEPIAGATTPDQLLDRARYAQYPPGSTFKLVTAMAALRLDPKLADQTFKCQRLPDGRAGAIIPGVHKPIRDDVGDSAHGTLSMERAITVSCNAYFAQLGVFSVGPKALSETAGQLEIPAGSVADLKAAMPFASYGQGPVLVTPFKMARVAATIAASGNMPQGRWVIDSSNSRTAAPRPIVAPNLADFLARAMRSVVLEGTGRRAMKGETISVAGKTGTAQLDEGMPHSWFAGFAPYDGDRSKSIAFAVVVEHGGYGGTTAAPIARAIVDAAAALGLVGSNP
ncbi:MAG TPA: FtsW/RodA/SpoVE family cell cycle protein, partial [Bryobacteraceae bacterium]|nr:FtsW/RodA/SpoVE family cell cycle protein [Bryobacteraceae bacterium]